MYEDLIHPIAPLLYGSATRLDGFAAAVSHPTQDLPVEAFAACYSSFQDST